MPGIITPRVASVPSKGLTAKTWAPVSYTSEVTGLSAGEALSFPQVSLQSGFNTPYFIDEIRFTTYTPVAYNATNDDDLSAIVGYQLGAGGHMFSQGGFGQTAYVPMILYAPTYSGATRDTFIAQHEVVQQADSGGTTRVFSTRRWVLPKPLFMPAGDVIQASVNRSASIGTSLPDVTAQVTVIGRALPPHTRTPPVRQIPYVGYYVHPGASSYSEGNFQLQNPFKSTWNVQRLILATRRTSTSRAVVGLGFYESSTGADRFASIKLTDSLGYKITGSSTGGFVPLSDVAAAARDAAWTFSRPLPPGEQYNAAIQITTGTVNNDAFDVLVSMVGYRDEG